MHLKYVYEETFAELSTVAEQKGDNTFTGGGGMDFDPKMYFYYTNRGAHIYLSWAAIPPAPEVTFTAPVPNYGSDTPTSRPKTGNSI